MNGHAGNRQAPKLEAFRGQGKSETIAPQNCSPRATTTRMARTNRCLLARALCAFCTTAHHCCLPSVAHIGAPERTGPVLDENFSCRLLRSWSGDLKSVEVRPACCSVIGLRMQLLSLLRQRVLRALITCFEICGPETKVSHQRRKRTDGPTPDPCLRARGRRGQAVGAQ